MTEHAASRERQQGQRPRIAVFTVTMNRLEYTTKSLASLRASTGVAFDHFVIDNGSTDGTQEYLRQNAAHFREIRLNETNTGLTQAWNTALDLIGDEYDFIVKVDNDCDFMDEGWLEALLEVSAAHEDRIILSPRVEGLIGQHRIDGGHARSSWIESAGHTVGLTNHVGGICLFAPSIAYADFRFRNTPMHGNLDVRFSMHAQLDLGFLIGYVEDVRVLHMDNTEGQLSRYPEYWAQRAQQSETVYGEAPFVTWMLRAPRRLLLLRRMARAGLLEGGLFSYLMARLSARLGPSREQEEPPVGVSESGDQGVGSPPRNPRAERERVGETGLEGDGF